MKKDSSNQNNNMCLSIVESAGDIYETTITSPLASLEIQSITPQIVQSPNANNEYHAIVSSTITTKNNESFTGLGEAYASESIPKVHVLECARNTSIANAAFLASLAVGSGFDRPQTSSTDVIEIETSGVISTPQNDLDKSKLNGGGNKPVSPKQKELIKKLAENQLTTGNKASMKICNIPLEELTGAQANQVIKKLKETDMY